MKFLDLLTTYKPKTKLPSLFSSIPCFSCECVRGYKGKTCQEMEFCQLQDCPMGSTCRNLNDGYECIANATFNGVNSSLSYSLGSDDTSSSESPLSTNFNSMEITFRYVLSLKKFLICNVV